jgi:hypothetical protein
VSTIATTWVRPEVNSVLLPLHAQTTDDVDDEEPEEDDMAPGVFNQSEHVVASSGLPYIVNLITPAHAVGATVFNQELIEVCVSLDELGEWMVRAMVRNWAIILDFDLPEAIDDIPHAIFEGTVPLDGEFVSLSDISNSCGDPASYANPDGDEIECSLHSFDATPGDRRVSFDFRIINNNGSVDNSIDVGEIVSSSSDNVCTEGGECPIACLPT